MSRHGTGTVGKTGAIGSGKGCHGYSPAHRSSSTSDRVKTTQRWFSDRLKQEITVARWGTFGRPVLVFPSAGGDAEEIERFGLIDACGPLLADGRVKLCSVDSVAGQAMVTKTGSPEHRTWLRVKFHACTQPDVLP